MYYFSPHSNQYGGFGGGGAGCYGGGGGGGFIGGAGGTCETCNGYGGFSYYNPDAVVLVLDARSELTPKSDVTRRKTKDLPKLWKHQGPGFVYIIPSLSDATCQVCSKFIFIGYLEILLIFL